ncbi:MAG: signal recognition particle protein [Rubrobacteraceae bacterium]|uniref:signal recognition particle protein n=1 Tax=Rubrobacter naiadicus TaxID=1392641 RepID=UPI00235F9A2D|nr:signal recognition particle protein [Rubrobacter naiadicus]MBX6762415.1 signal recognition particle protein [Rubrobacteraceae bacterium]MCL6437310.1 signal recognition particle protein [Rubrobacteraceae bacterium]
MFDTLSDRLNTALEGVRSSGTLTEDQVKKVTREIRLALLEADVNYNVVKEFVSNVRERATGAEVSKALSPGQQVVKIVNEELANLMGGTASKLTFASRPPTVVMLAGLNGHGKTTAAGKLALFVRKMGKHPYLIACDTYRPAAIDQLEQIGRELRVPVYSEGTEPAPEDIAERGIRRAKDEGYDFVIVDTAGRQVVDEQMMEELRRVRERIKPHSVLLVLDVVTGQNAVEVAQAFQEYADFDGMILTKLDGDARGGAALSVVSVTGRPIKFASEGEKMSEFDYFYPDRMAGRILGMGDVLTLIEKAEAQMDREQAEEQGRKLMSGKFTFEDFLKQMQMIKRMGPLSGLLGMIPGLGRQLKDVEIDDRVMGRVEAIITSMTPQERRNPKLLHNPSRVRRIARGSGTSPQEVQKLVKQFGEMQKMMRQMGKGRGFPKVPF